MTSRDTAAGDWPAVGQLRPGRRIEIRGLHADGQVYRWWPATVESADHGEIAVVWPAGTVFEAPTPAGRKVIRQDCRSIFWRDRRYFITEAYDPDDRLGEVFADIASPPRILDCNIEYVDYELAVVKPAGCVAFVEDEDEFLAAAKTYGYSQELQVHCRQALDEALRVVNEWVARGPVMVRERAERDGTG